MTVRVKKPAAVPEDRLEAFREEVRAASRQTAKLLARDPAAGLDEASARATLDTLRVQHEELLVAEEELRSQLDELGTAGLQLEAERERYVELFERAPDAAIVTDRGGVVRDANVAATRLLGIEIRFLRGKPLSVLVDPDEIPAVNGTLDRAGAGKVVTAALGLRPRGGRGVVRVRVHAAPTSRGTRVLWLLRVADSVSDAPVASRSEPAAAERALRDKRELLDRERRAVRELERTNAAKDKFIAVLSHDLRGPLSAILGWTQLLRREVLDAPARGRALDTVERNARTQAKLIDELLDISRMVADDMRLALTPIDLGTTLGKLVEGLAPRADELGLALAFEADADLVVLADRERLAQVFDNLLSNAMKFTPSGGRIVVEARRDDGDVRVFVRDSGAGIAPDVIGRIFELYAQERVRAAAQPGLGLGLYIVKRLVELHEGSVEVTSEGHGHGSTFVVRLPLHDELRVAPSEISIVPSVALRGVRVLVVDDEEDARELIATVLRRAGADVACAWDLKSGVERFAQWVPDVVVSDLAMPGGDGLELIRALRTHDPSFTALAVSGFASGRDAERAVAAGFDRHLAKPLDAAELLDAVQDASLRRGR